LFGVSEGDSQLPSPDKGFFGGGEGAAHGVDVFHKVEAFALIACPFIGRNVILKAFQLAGQLRLLTQTPPPWEPRV